MNLKYGVLLLVFLLSFRIVCAQKENNSVLEKIINLDIQNQSITSILDSISSQAHVFFSYDAILIEADKITNLSASGINLHETLDTLFNSNFIYQVLGDQIIISNHAETNTEPVLSKSKPIVFKGRVSDRERKDVLPYTGITILETNIGTLSNIDGDFELKIPEKNKNDTVVFSHLGFRQYRMPISEITGESYAIHLQPISIHLKEVKIIVLDAPQIVNKVIEKIGMNYPHDTEIMTAFYREVLKQDSKYIDVAEAVMDIRKAPYENANIPDRIKVVKGRKSHNVEASQFVDFKIQGGPYYITQLDVIKILGTFLDPEFRNSHKYWLDEVVEIDERKTYVIGFKPKEKTDYPCFQGKLFVDMSTLALVQAEFSLTRSGLKLASQTLIKKKPKDFSVQPLSADYMVSYRKANNKWHLSSAQAAINFKVRSKSDKVNSTFHSVSDLLITDFKPDDGANFKRDEVFNAKDIFTETITKYDDGFWGDYNTIKPSEDLQNALQDYYLKNDSLFKFKETEEGFLNKNY
jgi:hypothetical protein